MSERGERRQMACRSPPDRWELPNVLVRQEPEEEDDEEEDEGNGKDDNDHDSDDDGYSE